MSMPPALQPIPVDVLAPSEVGGNSAPTRGPWALMWRRLRGDKAALASMAFIILLFSFAAAAPLFESWTNHPKNTSNAAGSDNFTLLPMGPLGGCDGVTDVGKDTCFILGASNVSGHDMLVQLSYGARTSLFIGVVSTAITVVVALVMGLLAGYSGGLTDGVISRLMDVVAAFPFLLFAIAVSTVFRSNVWTVIFVIAAFSWFYPARLFRAEVLSLREREFVSAARMLGASTPRILRKHIFPHLVGATVVYASLSIAGAILFEAALSYLGFGLPADIPSWGRMISQAVPGGLYRNAPYLMVFPGTLLVLTALAFNMLGDGLRDALDPKGNVGR
ncbi:MAG: ABC transporter permease [Acidimicrobiia bacterium]|nr:ABC transporter permease [Acidimicrobiia bacterium]